MSALRLLCAAALALGPARSSSEVLAEAGERWDAGDYEGMIELLERAAAEDPNLDADYLFGLARAEVVLGRCDDAVEHLEAYLETDLSEGARESVNDELEKCGVDPRTVAPEPAPEPVPPPRSLTPDSVERTDQPRRADDAAGWSMVGAGGAFMLIGATLFAVGASRVARPGATRDEQAFRDHSLAGQRLGWSGVGLAAVGSVVLIGGVVRLALKQRRARRSGVAHRRAAPGM